MLLAVFTSAVLASHVIPDSSTLAEVVSGINIAQDGCHKDSQSSLSSRRRKTVIDFRNASIEKVCKFLNGSWNQAAVSYFVIHTHSSP
jgi:hypothetical protein